MSKRTIITEPDRTVGALARHFPMIRSRQEILADIYMKPELYALYQDWSEQRQKEFLDFCSGVKGLKVLYDGFFKEVFNPEYAPKRLEELLSLILNRRVTIQSALTNESTRLGSESTLLSTDIIVQLEDGSLADIEIQKIGYAFPGQRCACYSADHLLRQYKRVREKEGKSFTYRNVKQVYTIILLEKSTSEFHHFSEQWIHHFEQQSDTGIKLELLQEYYFIPLDIFRKNMENKDIHDELEAWLTFLTSDEPSQIEKLITCFPRFKLMYEDIYELCFNTEKVMQMYSKELQMLDHNTVLYMIDEAREETQRLEIETQRLEIETQRLEKERQQLEEKNQRLGEERQQLEEKNQRLGEERQQLEEKNQRLGEERQQLEEDNQRLEEKNQRLENEAQQAKEQARKLKELLLANGIDPIL